MKFDNICCGIILFLLMPVLANSQYKFKIKGYINNGNETSQKKVSVGDKIVLRFYNLKRADTTLVSDSGFVIEGEVPYPSIAMLEYKYGGDLLLLDNSSYSYYLDLKIIDSTHREYVSTIKTTSSFYTSWKNFQDDKADLFKKKDILLNRFENTNDPDSLLYKNTSIKQIDNEISNTYKQLAIHSSNRYAVAYIVPAAPDFSYAGYNEIYSSLPDSIKNTFYGKNFFNKLMASKQIDSNQVDKNVSLGIIPTIIAVDTSLKRIVLDLKYYVKNRFTLIEFWASWCSPCRVVNQELRQRMEAFKKANIQVIGFSLDNASEPWKAAVEKDRTGWVQLSDLKATESPVVKFFSIEAIPQNVIVDRNGKVIMRNVYANEIDKFLNTLESSYEGVSK